MGISAVKMLKKNSDILFKYSDIGLFHLFQHLGRSSFSFIKTILFQKITIQGAKSVKKVMCLRQGSNQGPLAWQSRVLTNTLSSQEGNYSNFEGEYQHLALGKCISFEIEAVVVASASAFLA